MKFLQYLALVIIISVSSLPAQSFENGEIGVALNDFGRVRLFDSDLASVQIDRFSILVAQSPTFVFDYFNDGDAVDTSQNIVPPTFGDFELQGISDNSFSGNPPALTNKINVFGWSSGKYLLVKYTLTSNESSAYNAKIGWEILPQVDNAYGLETVEYLNAEKVVRISKGDGSTNIGIKVLSEDIEALKLFEWFDGYNSVDDSLYNHLMHGVIDASYSSGVDGAVGIPSIASRNFAPGESIVVYVAIATGTDQADMLSSIAAAEALYNTITSIEIDNEIKPTEYKLSQNYPNPFNPSTQIQFQIIENGFVNLSVYNTIGEEVAVLINEDLQSGTYTVTFDAADKLTSGIYFYKMTSGSFSQVNKMMLIK